MLPTTAHRDAAVYSKPMLPTIGGRVRLNSFAVQFTVRWWKTGTRQYAGELEAMTGFVAEGHTLREVIAAISAQVISATVPADAPKDVRPAEQETGTSFFRKEIYRRHAIITASDKRSHAGWVTDVRVYDATGALEWTMLEVTVPTGELPDEVALQLGRAWVDRLQ